MDQGSAGSPGFHRPVVFESAVFKNGDETDARVYASWDEALAGHAELVAALGGQASSREVSFSAAQAEGWSGATRASWNGACGVRAGRAVDAAAASDGSPSGAGSV